MQANFMVGDFLLDKSYELKIINSLCELDYS